MQWRGTTLLWYQLNDLCQSYVQLASYVRSLAISILVSIVYFTIL